MELVWIYLGVAVDLQMIYYGFTKDVLWIY